MAQPVRQARRTLITELPRAACLPVDVLFTKNDDLDPAASQCAAGPRPCSPTSAVRWELVGLYASKAHLGCTGRTIDKCSTTATLSWVAMACGSQTDTTRRSSQPGKSKTKGTAC